MTIRIALVGVCQVVGMGEALRLLLPGAEVHPWHAHRYDEDIDRWLGLVADFDLVISQILPSHGIPELLEEQLRGRGIRNLHMVPAITFTGFHPDACLITDNGAQLESPIQNFHSRILAAAFLMDLPLHRTIRLFNLFVYAKLGYVTTFDAARAEFIRSMGEHGLGELVDGRLAEWSRPDAFMYTPLHPKIRVLSTFATEVARRAGLVDASVAEPHAVPDVLGEQHIWPVYPGLAERLGVPGDLMFHNYRSAVSSDAERALDLEEFAARSFQIYADAKAVLAANPYVVETAKTLAALIR
jgi:hypothetical protein